MTKRPKRAPKRTVSVAIAEQPTLRLPKPSVVVQKPPNVQGQLRLPRWLSPVVLVCVLLFFIFIRIRLRDLPLERDEGEYAYAGQLLLEGIPPYKLAYNMKLPGTYVAYAVIMSLFGQTPSGIHIGLLLMNAATTIMMFFLAKRLFGELAGLVAAAAYALVSIGVATMGLQAHATHFVVFAAVAGLLLFLRTVAGERPHSLVWSGLLFGAAILMKQPGFFLGLSAALQLLYEQWLRKQSSASTLTKTVVFLFGMTLPTVLACVIMALCGVFGKFWFWVFDYAQAYGSLTSWRDGFHALIEHGSDVVGPAIGVWILAAAGATAFVWDPQARKHGVLCLNFLLFSFLAVCPGLYFRQHYFILMLPAIALLAAVGVSSSTRLLSRYGRAVACLPVIIFCYAFGYALITQADPLFKFDTVNVSRLVYGLEPFPEAIAVSRYVEANSNSSDRIAVLGSEPEIYFYSHRHSATGYIYIFSLWEEQPYADKMQQEMISEIEAARPLYIVMHPAAWFKNGMHGSEARAEWARSYLKDYDITAVTEVVSPSQTVFRLWKKGEDHRPQRLLYMVFRRRGN